MHSQYTELMSLALDREADAAQMAALETHLKVCHACAAMWARWQMLDVRFRAAPLLTPPAHLAEHVLARLAARRRRAAWGGWLGIGLFIAWLLAVGVLLLACVAGVGWALAHPAQASIALSAGARLLSGVLWPVRSAEIVLASAGLSLQASATACLGFTCALFGVWVWLATRRRPLGPVHA